MLKNVNGISNKVTLPAQQCVELWCFADVKNDRLLSVATVWFYTQYFPFVMVYMLRQGKNF